MIDHSDEQLVRAFQAGDQSAFAAFAARHADELYRLARLWLFDHSAAGDVVQEIFLRSYTGLGRFRFRSQPKTWLYRVCRNVTSEYNRQTDRWHTVADAGALLERQQDVEAGPTTAVSAQEFTDGESLTASELARLLQQLPERQRQTITLRVLEELSVAETARAMGCRAGTVKASLSKGLANLRRLMYEQMER